jgi:pimeloyl-ACP methyl ester carboxylesterase
LAVVGVGVGVGGRGGWRVRHLGAYHGAELVIITSCGYLPQEERPQEFLTALANYVAKLSASSQ